MQLMRVYHVSTTYLDEEVELIPRVPNRLMAFEDNRYERVCCSTSILGAIKGSYLLQAYHRKVDDPKDDTIYNKMHTSNSFAVPFYVYYLDCPVEDIVQPRPTQVLDAHLTNEFWVIEKYVWKLYDVYWLRKGKDITEYLSVWHVQKSVYGQYPEWEKMPRNSDISGFGGDVDNFYFVDVNAYNWDKIQQSTGKDLNQREELSKLLCNDLDTVLDAIPTINEAVKDIKQSTFTLDHEEVTDKQ